MNNREIDDKIKKLVTEKNKFKKELIKITDKDKASLMRKRIIELNSQINMLMKMYEEGIR